MTKNAKTSSGCSLEENSGRSTWHFSAFHKAETIVREIHKTIVREIHKTIVKEIHTTIVKEIHKGQNGKSFLFFPLRFYGSVIFLPSTVHTPEHNVSY